MDIGNVPEKKLEGIKGIVLAGGTGSRLWPLTKVTNKHLLPVGSEPMIYHPIRKLASAGVKDILIVTGVEHMGSVINLLGSGRDFGVEFTYRVQDEAGGIAQALGLAKTFVGNDLMIVLLGDNIFESPLTHYIESYMELRGRAMILLTETDRPQAFGVASFEGHKLKAIVEKPQNPPSNLVVPGVYFYPPDVFDIVATLEPSDRGELEIADVNNRYLETGRLEYEKLSGWWTDAGTFETYSEVNKLVGHRPPKF